MIDHDPIEHTPLDVVFCGDSAQYAELKRMLDRLSAQLSRSRAQPLRLPVPRTESRKSVSYVPDTLVVDHGPDFTSAEIELLMAQLAGRAGCDRG